MRSEKRNRFLAILMALVLLVSVPAVWLRVQIASYQLTTQELVVKLSKNTGGTYLDRTGSVIKDSSGATPDILGNLLGFGNYVDNALIPAYEDQLGPTGFNRFTGVRSLENKQGCALQTTLLPLHCQQALADAFYDETTGRTYTGAIFAYNYKTGEVYTCLSLPSIGHVADDMPEGASFNKVIKGTFVPGSTMKLVALLCALEQTDLDLTDFRFTCDGKTELPDGNTVICGYAHGSSLSIEDAIGLSCNGFICTLASRFDVQQACDSLQRLDFSTQLHNTLPQQYVDVLKRSSSSTVFADPTAFADCWAFAGQGSTAVSCVSMAQIAGAIANNGQVAEPYLAQQKLDLDTGEISDMAQPVMRQLVSEQTANAAKDIWTAACKRYYKLSCPEITCAKTGTAEHGNGTGTSRSLIGTMEAYDTAFFIYVEGLEAGKDRCVRIAAVLADALKGVEPR